MPPRKQIEREAILDAAFRMTREGGFGSITARSLAASLGCSTQPIYQTFGDMKALEAEVARRGLRHMLEALAAGARPELPRELAFVLGYIRYALAEPHLTRLIAQNGLFRSFPQGEGVALPAIDPKLVIFANGVVFLTAFQAIRLPWEQIEAVTTEAYRAFEARKEEAEP